MGALTSLNFSSPNKYFGTRGTRSKVILSTRTILDTFPHLFGFMGGASCSRALKVDFIISDLLWFLCSRLKFLLLEVTSYNELLMCP